MEETHSFVFFLISFFFLNTFLGSIFCFVFVTLLFRTIVLGSLTTIFLLLNQSSNYACHNITNLYFLIVCAADNVFSHYLKDHKELCMKNC